MVMLQFMMLFVSALDADSDLKPAVCYFDTHQQDGHDQQGPIAGCGELTARFVVRDASARAAAQRHYFRTFLAR